MAQYLLAVRYADRKIPAEEFQRLCVDVPALDAKMEDAGVFVFHGGLHPPESATVVRQSGDDFLITAAADNAPAQEEETVPDDRLRLIFTCCHPALNQPAQVALTLRLLGGLETPEIARASGHRACLRPARTPRPVPDPGRHQRRPFRGA